MYAPIYNFALTYHEERGSHRVPCKIPSARLTTTPPQGLLQNGTHSLAWEGSQQPRGMPCLPAVCCSLPFSRAVSSLSRPRSTLGTGSQPELQLPAEGHFLPKTSQHQASALVKKPPDRLHHQTSRLKGVACPNLILGVSYVISWLNKPSVGVWAAIYVCPGLLSSFASLQRERERGKDCQKNFVPPGEGGSH